MLQPTDCGTRIGNEVRQRIDEWYGIELTPNEVWLAQAYARALIERNDVAHSAIPRCIRTHLLQTHYGLDELELGYLTNPRNGRPAALQLLKEPPFREYCRRHQTAWRTDHEHL